MASYTLLYYIKAYSSLPSAAGPLGGSGCAGQALLVYTVRSLPLYLSYIARGNRDSLPGGACPRAAGGGALETAHGAAPPHGPDVRYHMVAGAVLSRVRPRDLGQVRVVRLRRAREVRLQPCGVEVVGTVRPPLPGGTSAGTVRLRRRRCHGR
eukprot:scaffold60895_cov63-Phaeocystis_antarctica.AAC.6